MSKRPSYRFAIYMMEMVFQFLKLRESLCAGQGGDASRSYFQGQRPDPKLALQSRSNSDSRSQAHEENIDVRYEGNHLSQTFEGLEQNFHDDFVKLTKEQHDVEDAEHARHREVSFHPNL